VSDLEKGGMRGDIPTDVERAKYILRKEQKYWGLGEYRHLAKKKGLGLRAEIHSRGSLIPWGPPIGAEFL